MEGQAKTAMEMIGRLASRVAGAGQTLLGRGRALSHMCVRALRQAASGLRRAVPARGAPPVAATGRHTRAARHGLRLLTRAVLGLALLFGLAAGTLSWRLAQGPLELSWLSPKLRQGITLAAGTSLRAETLSLAWDGWRHGASALPALRLDGARLEAPGLQAEATAVLAHLSLPALLRGEFAPTLLELEAPRLRVGPGTAGDDDMDAAAEAMPATMLPWLAAPDETRRHFALRGLRIRGGAILLPAAAGRPGMALEDINLFAQRDREGLRADGSAALHLGGMVVPVTLQAMAAPAGSEVVLRLAGLQPGALAGLLPALAPQLAPLAGLQAMLSAGIVLQLDAGLVPRGAVLDLEAGPGQLSHAGHTLPLQGFSLRAEIRQGAVDLPHAELLLGPPAAPPLAHLIAQGRAWREDGRWRGEIETGLAAFEVTNLASLWPESLAPQWRAEAARLALAGSLRDATLGLALRDTAEGPRLIQGRMRLPLRDLRLGLGLGQGPSPGLAISEVLLMASGTPEALRLETARLVLPSPRPEAAPSIITGQADIRREGDAWTIAGDLGLDQLAFADLPTLWPEGIAPHPRKWMVENMLGGVAQEGQWRFDLALPDGQEPQLRALSGRARASAVTVQWLAPIPPAIGVSGEAQFGLDAITLAIAGGRQSRADGSATGIEITGGTLRFLDLAQTVQRADIQLQIAGSAADLMALLRHPRLHLFDRRPLELTVAEGSHATRLNLTFPMLEDIPNEAIRVRAESRLSGLRIGRALLGRELTQGQIELLLEADRLRLQGTANLLGAPLRLLIETDLRPGPATAVFSRETVQGTLSAAQLTQLGLDLGDVLGGAVAIEARTERRRNGQASVTLRGDLAPATLSLPAARWSKPQGSPGSAEAVVRLQGDTLLGVDNGRIDVLELSLRGRAIVNRGRIDRYEIAESLFGGSRFQGDVRPPGQPGAPWQTNLRGPLLDLRPIMAARRPAEERPDPGTMPPLVLEARFDRVTLGERRELLGVQGRAVVDDRAVLRQGFLRGRTAAAGGAFELVVAPRAQGRSLRITAEDGGAVLRALDGITSIEGGRLTLNGGWAGNEVNAALTGTAELEGFVVRGAPAIGKVLQAMTLFGLVDALQGGGGLSFNRANVPFSVNREVLTLNDAHAFSPSLGLTVRGRVLREADILDLEGTIVPAYMINTMLGNLPLVGRLFSPEPGGGVFATAFRVQGAASDPQVQVNPLSTITPGFLRGLFGLGQEPASTSQQAPARR